MKTLAYLVFYTTRWAEQEFYWTGAYLPSGKPQVSSDSALARAFTSAREAYEAAASCKRMARWKVGRRHIQGIQFARAFGEQNAALQELNVAQGAINPASQWR